VGKRRGIDRGVGAEDGAPEGEATGALVDAASTADAPAPSAHADVVADGSIKAVVNGTARTLASVEDGVFSSGMMGEGIAIDPFDGEVIAPCDAKVTVMMAESGHAVGLRLPNDLELLIHIGLDTVEMKGDGFTTHIDQGDTVRSGQRLVSFDRDKIAAAGHKDTVMMIVTSVGRAGKLELVPKGRVEAGKTTVIEYGS